MNDKRKWSELNLEERNAELRRLCDVYKGIKQITDQLNSPFFEGGNNYVAVTAEEAYEWADREATLERNYGTT